MKAERHHQYLKSLLPDHETRYIELQHSGMKKGKKTITHTHAQYLNTCSNSSPTCGTQQAHRTNV